MRRAGLAEGDCSRPPASDLGVTAERETGGRHGLEDRPIAAFSRD